MTDVNTATEPTDEESLDTTIEAEAADYNGDNADLTNDKRFNDYIKQARTLGKDTALGADAMPKLAISMVAAAKNGIIDLDQNKDAIKQVFGAYWASRTNKKYSIHAQGKESNASQVSKLKQFYNLGKNEQFDGEELFDRVVELYKEKVKTADKIKPVYHAYLDAARMANDWEASNGSTAPTDDEIEATFYPKEKDAPTLSKLIEKISKELTKIITGDREDGIKSQDTEISDANDKLREWLAKMTLAADLDAYRSEHARLQGLGLI
jgi:hypothetical protein